MFPKAEVWVDVTTCSDHAYLTLVLTENKMEGRGTVCFRYEAKWALDAGFKDVVQQAWVKPMNGSWDQIGKNLAKKRLGVGDEVETVKEELQLLLDKADLQLRYKAKLEWLRSGDRNTKYYHCR
ncbi:uncharacterized protein LOC132187889 [Corylus avellana]|uniref:uncharacterized protein LOC132187889 n=1 Tax=Corylus avellana TaxID=13451 RepID=UPI00286B8196|nr:uncharacterized protein LOC132187889 [Corylus avellana]